MALNPTDKIFFRPVTNRLIPVWKRMFGIQAPAQAKFVRFYCVDGFTLNIDQDLLAAVSDNFNDIFANNNASLGGFETGLLIFLPARFTRNHLESFVTMMYYGMTIVEETEAERIEELFNNFGIEIINNNPVDNELGLRSVRRNRSTIATTTTIRRESSRSSRANQRTNVRSGQRSGDRNIYEQQNNSDISDDNHNNNDGVNVTNPALIHPTQNEQVNPNLLPPSTNDDQQPSTSALDLSSTRSNNTPQHQHVDPNRLPPTTNDRQQPGQQPGQQLGPNICYINKGPRPAIGQPIINKDCYRRVPGKSSKRWVCQVCSEDFPSLNILRQHIKEDHPGKVRLVDKDTVFPNRKR